MTEDAEHSRMGCLAVLAISIFAISFALLLLMVVLGMPPE